MFVDNVNTIDELLPALHYIASNKNILPAESIKWIDSLGLYVLLKTEDSLFGGQDILIAGNPKSAPFQAECKHQQRGFKESEIFISSMFNDFSHWKVKVFNQREWDKSFSMLVEPTCDIARFILEKSNNSLEFDEDSNLIWLSEVVTRYNTTNDWLGLYDYKCSHCGIRITWWAFAQRKSCSKCAVEISHS